jgi:hypothetical protein
MYLLATHHRTNPAERAIRTAKSHILASIATCHISFPQDLWYLLLLKMKLTLNHMRPWTPNTARSAYDGLHGSSLDFFTHPLHSVGQLCVTHLPPNKHPSWVQHGLRAHYIAPALDHYRCDYVFVSSNQTPSLGIPTPSTISPTPYSTGPPYPRLLRSIR